MNTGWLWFWEASAIGCMLWYTVATVYIAVRGVADIRGMLVKLRQDNEKNSPAAPS